MYKPNLKARKNGVPILNKNDIDSIAEKVLYDYDPIFSQEPQRLDVENLAECYLDLDMDYKDLSYDESILGMIVFNDCYITVYDIENNQEKNIQTNGGTIFIDNSLLQKGSRRRERFTIGHEIGHWLLHKSKYSFNPDQLSVFDEPNEQTNPIIKCRTDKIESDETFRRTLVSEEDWLEWQANYLASALLMPKCIFINYVKEEFSSKGIMKGYYQYGYDKNLDLWINVLVCELADIFDVSLTAAKIRLKNLKFIREDNFNQQSFI